MNDDELREGLAAITAREQVRVAQEVVEERFLNGISQMLAPHDNWPMLDDAALRGGSGHCDPGPALAVGVSERQSRAADRCPELLSAVFQGCGGSQAPACPPPYPPPSLFLPPSHYPA